jgi:hypothetical protein
MICGLPQSLSRNRGQIFFRIIDPGFDLGGHLDKVAADVEK